MYSSYHFILNPSLYQFQLLSIQELVLLIKPHLFYCLQLIKEEMEKSFDQTEKTIIEARNSAMNSLRGVLKMRPTFSRNTNIINETLLVRKRKESECYSHPDTPVLQEKNQNNAYEENYITMEKIGEGSHGVVKKCIHRETNKQFAVKISVMESQHALFLKNNFRDIKKLKHPNILKYKAMYFDNKMHISYLIMEYLPYPNLLKAHIDTEEEFKHIFHLIFDALSYAHSNKICHRDIKPENILYDKSRQIVKIIDFGVGKNLNRRGRYEEMLTVTGTQFYRAPEMFMGGGYNQKIDNWAAGVTLYKLIMGKTPFESEYHSDTIDNILKGEIDYQATPLKYYSPLLKNFLSRLLKKDKKERLSSLEAKNHIWFEPTLHEIDLMKSQGLFMNFERSNTGMSLEESITELNRKSSASECIELGLGNNQKIGDSPVITSIEDKKKYLERWLADVKEDDRINEESEEFRFDLIQSDGNSDDESFKLEPMTEVPKKKNKLRLGKKMSFQVETI